MLFRRYCAHVMRNIWISSLWCWLLSLGVPIFLMCQWIRKLLAKPYTPEITSCIVGNISIGGNAKTPFVYRLACLLQDKGFRVGIIGKPYLAPQATRKAKFFYKDYPPEKMGDEMALLGLKLQCPVAVGSCRIAAAKLMMQHRQDHHIDYLIFDDGLQTPGLNADCKIALVSEESLGNGHLLPMGPRRSLWSFLESVDCIFHVSSYPDSHAPIIKKNPNFLKHHYHNEIVPINHFQDVIVMIGIAQPEALKRFLSKHIPKIQWLIQDDHLLPQSTIWKPLLHKTRPIILTEKDWIKIAQDLKPSDNIWIIPLDLEIHADVQRDILKKLGVK